MNWYTWLEHCWGHLEAGAWLRINSAVLPHPALAGFSKLSIAEPNGQQSDWVWRLDDGSRIHVHEHEDGSLIAHRDQYDPAHSAAYLVKHVALETTAGQIALAVAAAAALVRLARALLKA